MKLKSAQRVINADWRRFKEIAAGCANHASLLDNGPCNNWHRCCPTHS